MMDVVTLPRDEFLARYWQYRAGEHVTILAPTGWGKTYFTNELLRATATPDMPAVVLATKPRDDTVTSLQRSTRWPVVRDWPPPMGRRIASNGTSGWIVWPKHTYDITADDDRHYHVFRSAMIDPYKRGGSTRRRGYLPNKWIVVGDEIHGLANDYPPPSRHDPSLGRVMATVWTKGRSNNVGFWGGSQRPANIPMHAYSQPVHLFLGNDPDHRARQRYREIGGVSPDVVGMAVQALRPRQFLYINRTDRTMCAIGA
jgi:hypothetical protein